MPRLRYSAEAQKSMAEIAEYIFFEAGEAAADKFALALDGKCRALAALPGTVGRSRSELRPQLRSFAYKSHVIFFRYVDDVFEVVDIIHGRRDIEAHFDDG